MIDTAPVGENSAHENGLKPVVMKSSIRDTVAVDADSDCPAVECCCLIMRMCLDDVLEVMIAEPLPEGMSIEDFVPCDVRDTDCAPLCVLPALVDYGDSVECREITSDS